MQRVGAGTPPSALLFPSPLVVDLRATSCRRAYPSRPLRTLSPTAQSLNNIRETRGHKDLNHEVIVSISAYPGLVSYCTSLLYSLSSLGSLLRLPFLSGCLAIRRLFIPDSSMTMLYNFCCFFAGRLKGWATLTQGMHLCVDPTPHSHIYDNSLNLPAQVHDSHSGRHKPRRCQPSRGMAVTS